MAEDGFRNTAYGMGFEAGLDALRDVIGAAQALVADLEGAENAWQGVGVVAVEIRRLVDLRVALREAGYLRDVQTEAEICTGIHHGHAGRWMCSLGFGSLCDEGGTEGVRAGDGGGDSMTAADPAASSILAPASTLYAPWMVDGRRPTIADYMEVANG